MSASDEQELARFVDLSAAGLTDVVSVDFRHRDGVAEGGAPAGGTTQVFAVRLTVEEVIDRLTETHGPPEVHDDGPAWLRGPRWSMTWEDERVRRGAMLLALAVEARPPSIPADQIPDDAAGLVLVDRFHAMVPRSDGSPLEAVRSSPTPGERARPSWLRRFLGGR